MFHCIVLTGMLAGNAIAATAEGNRGLIDANAFVADITVKGTVVDEDEEPLPGVTITVKGMSMGTVTDINGAYSLTAPDNATLVFSFIGFES